MKKRILSTLLIMAIIIIIAPSVSAKTQESAKGENIFFYALDADGNAVLMKIVPLDDIKAISHGQPNGDNYYISTTDNYPTTQYCEARGITVMELIEHVKSITTVAGASSIGFSGDDTIRLMATDSYGNYNRSWTHDELYGVARYYFEGLYDRQIGWKNAWEIAGEDISMFGMTLEEYYANYRDSDPFYDDKRAVFDTGIESTPILATVSYSGRTTTDALINSTEPGIADYIAGNGGVVAGSLADVMEDTWSLRLSLPMTESDLMGARRTAYDNFKWIYNMQLEMVDAPSIRSLGTVAEPVANVTITGDTMTITISCETQDASIYWSDDGAPQILYTEPIRIDIAGRNLAANPVTFYATAVMEGYDDTGIITYKYPGLAPVFRTQYNAMTGQAVVFEAADAVSAADWGAWTDAITFVTMKAPSDGGYVRVDDSMITIGERSISFDASLFMETGSFSFIFHAVNYADKSVSLTVKNAAPEVSPPSFTNIGMPLIFRFDDEDYQSGAMLYISSEDNPNGVMVATSWLDRTAPGIITLKAAYFDTPSCAIMEPGEYTFSFVNSRYEPGTIDVELRIESGEPGIWDDVVSDDWYFDGVRFVMGLGLFDEADEGEFTPDLPMTRAMLAVALYRLEQLGIRNEELGVREIRNSEFGIRNEDEGYDGRAQNTPNFSLLTHNFTDADLISDFAVDAMEWAVANGLINGTSDTALSPQGTATRAQVATIIMRFSQ